MRYKVKAMDDDQLRLAEALVEGRARIYSTSDLFRFVATGDLSDELQDQLRAIGVRIIPEKMYDLDSTAP